jgi:hypothetical protein
MVLEEEVNIIFLVCLLLNNNLKNYLLLFVYGENSLHNAIVNKFSWFKDYGIYH